MPSFDLFRFELIDRESFCPNCRVENKNEGSNKILTPDQYSKQDQGIHDPYNHNKHQLGPAYLSPIITWC